MRVAEHGEPVGLHLQHGVERFVERRGRLVRQAVDEVEIDRAVAEFAHPIHRLLRHLARLDAMNGLLHLGIEILHAHRGAVEADLAQRHHVIAREPARIHLHAGFDVGRKREMLVDDFAEPADFVGPQKRGRAAAEVELHGFAALVQVRRHLGDFAAEVIDVVPALVVIERDDGGAAAEPAERFAERDVEIDREVARRAVVRLDLRRELLPRHGVGELGRGRIAGVTRPGHVVFFTSRDLRSAFSWQRINAKRKCKGIFIWNWVALNSSSWFLQFRPTPQCSPAWRPASNRGRD